jgi:hypothetical protein
MNGGNTDILPQLAMSTGAASPTNAETPKARKERANPVSGKQFDAAMLNQIISSLPSSSDSKKKIELSKVLTRANVEETVKKNAEILKPHLPTTADDKEINHTIGSPQFQQAADFFGSALYSGQLGG